MTFYDLWFSKIFHNHGNLCGCEELGTSAVMELCQGFQQRRTAVDPTHQMVGGNARVAVGKVEHGKLLFAVTFYFHIRFRLMIYIFGTRISRISRILFLTMAVAMSI